MGDTEFKGHRGDIVGIAISPEGSKAVSGAHIAQFSDDAIVWDWSSGSIERRLGGHKAGVFSIAYRPDGKMIATGGGGMAQGSSWVYDHAIRLWNDRGDQVHRFGEELFFVYALAFSSDSRFLLSGSGNHAPKAPKADGLCLRVWEVATGKQVRTFGHHAAPVTSVAFSPDGQYVVAGTSGMKADRSLQSLSVIKTGSAKPRSVTESLKAFVGFGRRNAVSATKTHDSPRSRTIRVWETDSGREISRFAHQDWVNSVAFSPDGKQLLSGGKGVIFWDFAAGKEQSRIGGTETAFTHRAVFSPDGQRIATGTGGRLEMGAAYQNCCTRIYDVASGRETARWDHEYPVKALAFSMDGGEILAGGERGELRRWKIAR
jgi:WD40 repeat protein